MYLSKLKNGNYYIYLVNHQGKRTRVSTKTNKKAEALKFFQKYAQEFEEEKINGYLSISLKDFIWSFLKHSESIHSDKTIKAFKLTFKHFQDFTGNMQLDSIDKKVLTRYFTYRLSNSSIFQARKDRINLSSMFSRAIEEGYLRTNPCRDIKPFKIPEKQPLFYTKEEYEKLLANIEQKDISDIVQFAVNTGMRQMEIITLTWSQVDFERKLITLDNRQHLTKSKKVRTIPLNETAFNVLNERFNHDHDRVFTYNNKPINQDTFSQKFNKIIISSGLNPKLNFHSLRHTFASWLAQKGTSIYHISKLLGHANVKTTEIYAHLQQEDLRNAVNNL